MWESIFWNLTLPSGEKKIIRYRHSSFFSMPVWHFPLILKLLCSINDLFCFGWSFIEIVMHLLPLSNKPLELKNFWVTSMSFCSSISYIIREGYGVDLCWTNVSTYFVWQLINNHVEQVRRKRVSLLYSSSKANFLGFPAWSTQFGCGGIITILNLVYQTSRKSNWLRGAKYWAV